jgi:PLP dependent protein
MPFLDLADRVAEVRERIAAAVQRGGHGQDVTIVAVTKTHGPDAADAAFDAGITDVGENRVQEALRKMPDADLRLRWHLIGHLQRNKVKALEQFELFHALDSSRIADAVNDFGMSHSSPVRVLMQVNVSGEETKGGFGRGEVDAEAARLAGMRGLRIAGVMTMAPFDASEAVLRETFAGARAMLERVRAAGHKATELSMGMSGDYEVAVEEGATLVRLGTILFGTRET